MELAERQHGTVARWQLQHLGFTTGGMRHLMATGRLHRVARGVYAAGRREIEKHGVWMAAVLGCGPGALLSHGSGGELWQIGDERFAATEVSVVAGRPRARPGVVAHRRSRLRDWERSVHEGIPVTSVASTIIDIASYATRGEIERAIREADKRGWIHPDALRVAVDAVAPRPGVGVLREILDRSTLLLTDTELERLFVPIARSAGLPDPEPQAWVNGFRVDFFWPDLGLVVETDGLTYHRTPSQQARDRIRDNAHLSAGLTPLRFTHGQVRYEPGYVRATLAVTARRLTQRRNGR